MKIGLVFDDSLDRPDGVQQYVLAIGRWMTQQGHEVHYLVGQTQRTDIPYVHSLARNVGVRFNGNRLTIPLPVRSARLRTLLHKERFDVLHVMMPYSPLFAHKVIQSAPKNTRVIGTFHILPQNRLVRWSTVLLGVWLQRSLKRFDVVCAVSSSAQRFAEQAFGLRQDQVIVLPNVVDVAHFYTAQPLPAQQLVPQHTSVSRHVVTVMFLGRLVPRKGCGDLLRAVAIVRQAVERQGVVLRVVICGKGPQREALEIMVQAEGIADIVTFTGFVSEADKPRYIAAADVMVFPSIGGESFGIVLIEAMASGRPVVLAAANPGYATVMEPQPDQLFAPGDVTQLANTLEYVVLDKTVRTRATAWQQRYVKQFDTAVVGRELEQLYQQGLQKKA